MKNRNFTRPVLAAIALVAAAWGPAAVAADGEQLQSAPGGSTQATPPGPGYPGYRMGPGMMGGYGANNRSGQDNDDSSGPPYGPGAMWGNRGYGPGMMWGYGGNGGYGPGMMGGYGGYGPGMMGGYGGYGPGMMGGYGGYGPGMMGGYGGYGPGMMGGYGGYGGMMGAGCGWVVGSVNLNSDQQGKIEQVCEATRKKEWELAGKLIDERQRLRDMLLGDRRDPRALGQELAKSQAIQRQMFELSVDTGNRVEALLTPQQKQQYQEMRRWGPRW